MDKKYLIAAGSIIAIIMFLAEPLYWGGGINLGGGAPSSGTNITGEARFNGTIRTYDPLLFLPADTPQEVLDALRQRDDILDVQQQGGSYVARTETRDDVYPAYRWLAGQNVTAYAIANVALSDRIVVDTPGGQMNATLIGGVVRVVSEPIVDAGSDVSVRMVAVVSRGAVIDYSSASLEYGEIEALIDATVESVDSTVYSYSIPWESRNSVDLMPYPDHEYARIDTVVFNPPLGVSQILAKKQFPYVTYIDSGSMQVLPSFDNLTALEENFADTPFTLPPSRLAISSGQQPEIPFVPEVSYRYTLRIGESPYDFGDGMMALESRDSFPPNETLKINMSLVVLGDRVISVRRASLPS